MYQAPPRHSFIAALKDVPEIWKIATDPNAPPVYPGLVHSHEKGMIEALPSSQGLFALRRIEVPEPLYDYFFFDPPYRNLIGSAREGKAIVSISPLAATSSNWPCPACRISVREFPGPGTGGR